MKRIVITYGSVDYSIADTDLDEVKAAVLNAAATGRPAWLRVNHGEGSYRETDILIGPGTSIAITGIEDDQLVEEA